MTFRRTAALAAIVSAVACKGTGLPDPASPAYEETVATFYRGIAAAQAGETGLAEAAFRRVTELAPSEPAGWVNLGLIALERRQLGDAERWLDEARTRAPDYGHVLLVSALVAREAGRVDEAVEHLRSAVALDPQHLRARYLLAELLEQQEDPQSVAEAQEQIEQILTLAPGNLAALLERARLAARLRDTAALRQTLDDIAARAASLGSPLLDNVETIRAAGAAGEFDRAATEVTFLQTDLQVLAAYRDDQDAVRTSPTRTDVLVTSFVRMASPTARSAPPDTGLRFAAESLAIGGEPVAWVRAMWLSEEVPLALVAANRDTVWVSTEPGRAEPYSFPGGDPGQPLSTAVVAPLDYDHDFRMDLVLAGAHGLRVLRQEEGSRFTDATGAVVPARVTREAYAGAWAADLDLEGDLDLVLAPLAGAPSLLRNRGDGTFEAFSDFADVRELRDFVWADLDADGDPDATLLDASGDVHVFLNERSATTRFRALSLPATIGQVDAITAADQDGDATIELLLFGADGSLRALALEEAGWIDRTMARWPDFQSSGSALTKLHVADLDNNGDLDLVASTPSGTRVWLGTSADLLPLPLTTDAWVTGLADLSGAGRVDLLGVSNGRTRMLTGQATTNYFSASIRPRAAETTGDRRINAFGIGGEIEVRAGLLYQKQLITSPVIRFGLGEQAQVDVARIIWPNGTVQAEFNLAATNETILTRQRLKGSCPWVFTFNGEGMQFVTDFIWRSALGLRINAQGDAQVIHSEDWVKIRGDQLAPRDGYYDIRVTAELWETHFFDHVSLMVVDHPDDTDVFVDERFSLPAPETAVYAMQRVQPVAWARDDAGRDVTELIRDRDERFLDTFALGPFQGIADEHYVELALGSGVPADGPLWLVAFGWVYPTDASINVAVSQGTSAAPYGLVLEVPDGQGGWEVAEADVGFPAGKTKTVLIDLQNRFRSGTERRVRLRTNMEVYWDHIGWAVGRPDAPVLTRRLLPTTATLRYRGFSEVRQASRRAPELPVYDQIATATPQWRDLVGFHTRFGDVRALNEAVDDRYTIMNAGDELLLRFPAPSPPPAGWTRDFVLIGDGWVKDGDFNTGFSTTVLPLPYHGMHDYDRAPDRLVNDPAYGRHPKDWQTYHTRYVTPRDFYRALVLDRP